MFNANRIVLLSLLKFTIVTNLGFFDRHAYSNLLINQSV